MKLPKRPLRTGERVMVTLVSGEKLIGKWEESFAGLVTFSCEDAPPTGFYVFHVATVERVRGRNKSRRIRDEGNEHDY